MPESHLPQSFEELIRQSKLPVLADFWAEWCMPCKMLAPIIHRLADELKGRLVVVKINIDTQPDLAASFQIQSVPTLILFRNGTVVSRQSGALPLEQLKQMVLPYLTDSGTHDQ
ncbi:MAG: thioredoxin [Candidatus Delongbacteria bacterium]|nr:thioredoxin [Candidatus Delongbacteria bacterium]